MITQPKPPPSLCNFLFILPASTTLVEQKAVENVAKRLTQNGYVYVASARERIMEDRDGIRFMPWSPDRPPGFGMVTGVFVLNDAQTALAAADVYPGASVWLIQPTQSDTKPTTREDHTPVASVTHAPPNTLLAAA